MPSNLVRSEAGWASPIPTRPSPRFYLAAAIAVSGVLTFVPAARAEDVSPDDGLTAVVGSETLSIYYHPNAMGYQVVVTAGTAQSGSVIRFEAVLVPGQYMRVSAPRGAGEPPIELRLYRVGDRVTIVRPTS